jgi:hypothetical protein
VNRSLVRPATDDDVTTASALPRISRYLFLLAVRYTVPFFSRAGFVAIPSSVLKAKQKNWFENAGGPFHTSQPRIGTECWDVQTRGYQSWTPLLFRKTAHVHTFLHPLPTQTPLSTVSMPSKLVLPDLLSICPINGSTNPHYETATAESRAWLNSFNIFHGENLTLLLACNSELLVSHTYPYAAYEQFRTACDFVTLLFVIDEVSDDQNGKDARQTGLVYLNVMMDPAWDDGSKLAQMTRECVSSLYSLHVQRPYRCSRETAFSASELVSCARPDRTVKGAS